MLNNYGALSVETTLEILGPIRFFNSMFFAFKTGTLIILINCHDLLPMTS